MSAVWKHYYWDILDDLETELVSPADVRELIYVLEKHLSDEVQPNE